MKKSFPGYYRPTKKGFAEMWEGGTFVLDANVLLNLYRYSPETRDELLGILQANSDRLWLPHQAAKEYHKNRIFVIQQVAEVYDSIKKLLEDSQNKIQNELRSMIGKGRHPFVGENLIDKITTLFTGLQEEIINLGQNHPNLIEDDPILDTITNLFENKVGSAYNSDELNKIYQKGKERYDKKIPPGYKDNAKGELEQFGDLVMWFQIIDYAKKNKLSIIFVTDDRKDDWWLRIKGQTIGPHPELIQEIVSEAEVPFYMYSTDPFMEQAREHLKRKVKQQAIEEVREIRKLDEIYLENVRETLVAMKAAMNYPMVNEEMMAAMNAAINYPKANEAAIAAMNAAMNYPKANEAMMAAINATMNYPKVGGAAIEAMNAAMNYPKVGGAAIEAMNAAMNYPKVGGAVIEAMNAAVNYPKANEAMMAAMNAAMNYPKANEAMIAAMNAAMNYSTLTEDMLAATNTTVNIKSKIPTTRKLKGKAAKRRTNKEGLNNSKKSNSE